VYPAPPTSMVGQVVRLGAELDPHSLTGWNVLNSEKSMFTKPGARKFPTKRDTLPNVKLPVWENTEVSKYRSSREEIGPSASGLAVCIGSLAWIPRPTRFCPLRSPVADRLERRDAVDLPSADGESA